MGDAVIIDNLARFWDAISNVVHPSERPSVGPSMAAGIGRAIKPRLSSTEEEG